MVQPLSNYSAQIALKELGEEFTLALSRWVKRTEPQTLWQSCGNCIHMNKKGPAFCRKYALVPPVSVIIGTLDCEGWQDEEGIPF